MLKIANNRKLNKIYFKGARTDYAEYLSKERIHKCLSFLFVAQSR